MHSKPPSKPTAKPPKGAIALLKARPDHPTPHARRRDIDALKADPARAVDFDKRYGPGSAQVHLLAEMCDLLEELIDHVTAPKKVVTNAAGEVVGVEAD